MRCLITLALVALWSAAAAAGDIQGKWGFGAGLFDDASELTIIRGHSDRTAWLMQLQFDAAWQKMSNIIPDRVESANVAFGPGIRRFTRPESEFSPYLDLFTLGTWVHRELEDSYRLRAWGIRAGLSLGAEYFLSRWHCSVAAHSEIASYSYQSFKTTALQPTGSDSKLTASGFAVGLEPGLVLRVYF